MKHPDLSREEFELYALLYAANIDLKLSEQEVSLLTAEEEPQVFDRVTRLYKEDSEVERVETIKSFAEQHLKTSEEKEAFLNSLQSVFQADKKFSSLEIASLAILKQIIY